MKNVLNCQITRIKKMGAKIFKFFHILLKYYYKSFFRLVEKSRTLILNVANIHILLVRKEIWCAKQQNHSGWLKNDICFLNGM